MASYSRGQEYEADSLGVRYLRRAGFDPEAMADFLASLQAQSELAAQIAGARDNGGSIMASHPRTQDRVQAAIKEANSGVPPRNPIEDREVYLRKIDGMIYGDSPNHGLVRGNRFAHQTLQFGFEVPRNFRLTNQADRVVARGPQNTMIQFSQVRDSATPLDYLRKIRVGNIETLTVNGMAAATGTLRGNTQQGPTELRVVAIRFDSNALYQFLFLVPVHLVSKLDGELRQTVNSFHRLSAQEAAALRPLRIQVAQVRPGDTIESLAERTAFADHKLQRFMVLNGLREGASLRPGQLIKLVVEGNAAQQGS